MKTATIADCRVLFTVFLGVLGLTALGSVVVTRQGQASQELNNLWMEKAVRQNLEAANQAMLQVAEDPQQSIYRRVAAVENLQRYGGPAIRPAMERLLQSVPESKLREDGWSQFVGRIRGYLQLLPYSSAKTPAERYSLLTNDLATTRSLGYLGVDELIEFGQERDWPLIEQAVKYKSPIPGWTPPTPPPDHVKMRRLQLDLVQLSRTDPAAYTNTLREIAAEWFLPDWWHTHGRSMERQAVAEAKHKSEPHLQKVDPADHWSLQQWAFWRLMGPGAARQQHELAVLSRLLDTGVLTTNDLRTCTVPALKTVIDQYILGTNRPPWKPVAP